MFGSRLDLPLAQDATGRFLAWIMAVMVYLAILALAAAMVLAGMAARWETGLTGRLTVQISPLPDQATQLSLERRTDIALALLRGAPGILDAQAVSTATAHKLLEPWLGTNLPKDLPLPALIDVTIAPDHRLELASLAQTLAQAVPGARLDNNAAWLEDLRTLARTAQIVALAVIVLVGGAAVAAVVFAVRTGLAIHSPVVELLHMMGATDGYVARQFQAHVFELALRGGVLGLGMGFATLLALDQATNVSAGLLPEMGMTGLEWLALTGVPLVAGALAMITARWTVFRVLAAMP